MTRRSVIGGIGGAAGALFGGTSIARAQETTETAERGNQITRTAVIPDVGEPFTGNYVGQFLLFTDPTSDDDVSPPAVADCDAVGWPPERTRVYQVLLVDRLTDDPQGVVLQAYLDESQPRIGVGNALIVNRAHDCTGDYLALELENVPVQTFVPEYGTVQHPLVGESPGPTVAPVGQGTATEEDGPLDTPGQSGFGILAALVGLGGGALLRRDLRRK